MRTRNFSLLTLMLLLCGFVCVHASEMLSTSQLANVNSGTFTIGTKSGQSSEYVFFTSEKLSTSPEYYIATEMKNGIAQVLITFRASNGEFFTIHRNVTTNSDFGSVSSSYNQPEGKLVNNIPGYMVYTQETADGVKVQIVFTVSGEDRMLGVTLKKNS